jgi:hypothetical protein
MLDPEVVVGKSAAAAATGVEGGGRAASEGEAAASRRQPRLAAYSLNSPFTSLQVFCSVGTGLSAIGTKSM